MQNSDLLLQMTDISKTFPGVKALDRVSFSVRRGEVMGLLGENGAGKSTLVKIITGYYHRDGGGGDYRFDGHPVHPASTLAAQKLGISTIFQELNLSPFLSIAENIYLGNQPRKRGAIDWKQMNRDAARAMAALGVEVDVSRPIHTQSAAIQQMAAIARALALDTKLLILDEATSSLEPSEVAVLFKMIRGLKEQGIAVVYVTHKLDEVYQICDRGTILKDGQLVTCRPMVELPKAELISLMIGRDAVEIVNQKKTHNPKIQENQLFYEAREVRKTNHRLDGISVNVKKGEIVGLAGLLGSGRTELARVIFGDDQKYVGETYLGSMSVRFRSPADAVRHRMAFCPEERKTEGIFPFMSIGDNITMPQTGRISRLGLVRQKKQREIAGEYMAKLSIKAPSLKTQIRDLSGGNQQKVVFSRWLAMEPDMIILDEPTRGIDVGAKQEIEALISDIAAQGISVLYISSEIDELVRNCDRIIVMYEGKKARELVGAQISSQSILDAIAQGPARDPGCGGNAPAGTAPE